jgi:hypothetical protein
MSRSAGLCNTTGSNNFFAGSSAGQANTTGCYNTFIGYQAGLRNTTGNHNFFGGYRAGLCSTTGCNNNFIGRNAGQCNTTGNSNTFIGSYAGRRTTFGTENIFIGTESGQCNVTGNCNVFIGRFAGQQNTFACNNTFIGNAAGSSVTTGSNNTIIGCIAGTAGLTSTLIMAAGACERLRVDDTGLCINGNQNLQFNSLGIGTAASGTAGEIRATNNITAYYSDDRLKTKLGNIESALEKVKSLSGFYYQANQVAQALGYEVRREVGVSAQQVQNVLPEAVAPAPIDEQYLTVRYEKMIPLLIEAIKELDIKLTDIKNHIK